MTNIIDANGYFSVRRCMASIERQLAKYNQLTRYSVHAMDNYKEIWLYDNQTNSYIGPVDTALLLRN